MKSCPNCHLNYDDTVSICAQCGTTLTYVADSTDHTARFTKEDISSNKVLAMIPYLMGWVGIIIALLASGTSEYASFHVKQALKIQVVTILSVLLNIVPLLGTIAFGILGVVLFVVNIICFVNVCKGLAKEPLIVSSIPFLK
ncbi:MAG: zinc ribbon domain-containing protein [Ruminococcaceae bacterium]|nr:zinc ribbon domain-containing protein [Oscillospiraceae bacterium]